MRLAIITISREMCSFGDEIAAALSQKLGWELIDRDKLIHKFAADVSGPHELHMLSESAKYYLNICNRNITFLEHYKRSLDDYLIDNSTVLQGFGSQLLYANRKDALHIRVIAPENVRIIRLKKQYRLSDEEAAQLLTKADRKHKRFVNAIFNTDITDPSLYNLILNTAHMSVDECLACIMALHNERQLRLDMERETEGRNIINKASELPIYKNASETEFAKILDMYHIDWKYEPKTFPTAWDAEGNVVSAFSPDFYLPQFDTYIELTTMDQRYVTEKNKKVKRLKELYPGVNIKIVYKKDFASLIERFSGSKVD